MVVNFRTARRGETHTLTAVIAHIVASRECGRMTSDPRYQELQSKPPPDGSRTHAGNDDPSLDVTARAPGSPDTLDAQRDQGGLPRLLPRGALLRRGSTCVSLFLLVPWELSRLDPIVDLRLFGHRQVRYLRGVDARRGGHPVQVDPDPAQLAQTNFQYTPTWSGLAFSAMGGAARRAAARLCADRPDRAAAGDAVVLH
jgi:hypothetical protein